MDIQASHGGPDTAPGVGKADVWCVMRTVFVRQQVQFAHCADYVWRALEFQYGLGVRNFM